MKILSLGMLMYVKVANNKCLHKCKALFSNAKQSTALIQHKICTSRYKPNVYIFVRIEFKKIKLHFEGGDIHEHLSNRVSMQLHIELYDPCKHAKTGPVLGRCSHISMV